MQTPSSVEIFRYWQQVRGSRAAPLRNEIEPGRIRHLLADLFILERDGWSSPRFRLAGTRICGLFGRELRGTTFDRLWRVTEMEDPSATARRVMADHSPAFLSATGTAGRGETLDVELVLLPLKSGDGPADRIIGALVPREKPVWLGAYPLSALTLTGHGVPEADSAMADGAPHDVPSRVPAGLPRGNPWSQAVRRVLHLSVLDGGRQE